MKIEAITSNHPNLNNREITLLLVDDKIDIPSTRYLVYESRYGGRHKSLLGKSSHFPIATQIKELYIHLDSIGLKWNEATEYDIKRIRNAMLCWDKNDQKDFVNYDYTPISNDSMNHKLNTWFKFYKYMEQIGIPNNMTLTTKKIRMYEKKEMLSHLNSDNSSYIDVWNLKVKPSPKKNSYNALSKMEFSKLSVHLFRIDIVYQMIALYMVETGLRVDAVLKVSKEDVNGVFKLLSNGKDFNDVVKRKYTPKGRDDLSDYELPIRLMQTINDSYLKREYEERRYLYEISCDKKQKKIKDNILWITKNGKEVMYYDIQRAFKNVSKKMGRITNPITSHWLRHTFATWTIMDIANYKNIKLENSGLAPNPLLILALQQKLGHADSTTTLKYIVTALKLMKIDVNDGPVSISLRSFKQNSKVQELIKKEAKLEFGIEFDKEKFDVIKYAISRGIVIDDQV